MLIYFSQINAGNAIALPFAKGFGWGSEITLEAIFERLFQGDFGGGYPKERREPEQANKKILDSVKTVTCRPLTEILSSLDRVSSYRQSIVRHFENCFSNIVKMTGFEPR